MARLTQQQWDIARAVWESDPTMVDATVGKRFGVNAETVRVRRHKEGWKRDPDALAKIAAHAHVDADNLGTDPNYGISGKLLHNRVKTRPVADISTAVDERVRVRAEVLDRHRKEVAMLRGRVYGAIKDDSRDKLAFAKVATDTIKVIQDMERRAFGLDAIEGPLPGGVLVIERE